MSENFFRSVLLQDVLERVATGEVTGYFRDLLAGLWQEWRQLANRSPLRKAPGRSRRVPSWPRWAAPAVSVVADRWQPGLV